MEVIGTTAHELIVGTTGNDTINALEGSDVVYGLPGADVLVGSEGFDQVFGGQDDDQLFGGLDSDTLSGDLGNDTSYGGLGSDQLFGGDGNDSLSGQDGPDILIRSTFQTSSETQVDFLNGGSGADIFVLDRQVTSYGRNGHYAVIEDFEFGDLIDIDTSDYVVLPTSIPGLGTGVAIYGSSLLYQPGTTEYLVGFVQNVSEINSTSFI